MVLTNWWLALVCLAVVAALCAWWWLTSLRRRQVVPGGLRLAHVDRVRALPRFQQLARRLVFWLRIELVLVAVTFAGALLMIARPVTVGDDSPEMKRRDVMLCLDVSGSMTNADQVVLRSYLRLVERLKGERIGLVVWNSSGSVAFPLTDDYVFVREQLTSMLAAMGDGAAAASAREGRAVLQAANIGDGSSLIGDGAMSCLLRFDQSDRVRPRTVVLATDNQLAGSSIFTLPEAGEKAVADRVLIMGISPGLREGPDKEEFRTVVESTGGRLIDITDDPTMEARIAEAIKRQQSKAIRGLPSARSFDLVWPGALLAALGAAGMLITVVRGRT